MTTVSTRQDTTALLDRFRDVRARTDRLVRDLTPEDQTPQSMTTASPVKWHRAHTTWFFEEFVLGADPGYRPRDPAFRYLFNSYYETVGERHPRAARGQVTRPGVAEVAAYRADVEQQVADRVCAGTLDESSLALVELGCHHEEQHQELLLTDFKHLLSGNVIQPAHVDRAADPDPTAEPAPLRWMHVPGGVTRVGDAGEGFAFDNERPRHRVWLEDVELAGRQVTNAEWTEFIADGAYEQPDLWLSDGWATLQSQGWRAPGYWRHDEDEGWTTFTLSGRRPVVAAEPVCHISFFEADAFARWAGYRLPTEHEWEAWAASGQEVRGGLLDPERCHPDLAREVTLGNVWEWTASAYLPYPGFVTAPGAVGEYNGKFMNDQHVLRGASAVTPPEHPRITYRNFFPADSRWVFAGLRLAR
ncbi:ergothioneine biosynthesis protein EgtB [Janibacter alittae]|uniref:Ergothioneine biosynthesis protein EgtB n=1 Tax=Janibacter alittae TaxID=3115209 RepID=A0ABZ2MHS4_9MICO